MSPHLISGRVRGCSVSLMTSARSDLRHSNTRTKPRPWGNTSYSLHRAAVSRVGVVRGCGGAVLDDVDAVELLQGADLPDRGLADAVLQPLQRDLLEGDYLACNAPPHVTAPRAGDMWSPDWLCLARITIPWAPSPTLPSTV